MGMSHAACTVNVVTTDGVAGRHGVTVSAMVSVSADTPQPTLAGLHPPSEPGGRGGAEERRVLRQCAARRSGAYFRQLCRAAAGLTNASKFDCADLDHAIDRSSARGRFAGRVRLPRDGKRTRGIALRGVRLGAGHLRCRRRRSLDLCESRLRSAAAISSAAHAAPPRAAAGALAVGCDQVLAPYIVPALVARLTKLHPEIALDAGGVGSRTSDRQPAAQRHRRLRCSMTSAWARILQVERLAELTPYVLLPEGHPLAADVRHRPGRYWCRSRWRCSTSNRAGSTFLSLFRGRGLEPNHPAFAPKSLEMVRVIVGHGLGYSILATRPANNMTYDGRALVARPLSHRDCEQARSSLATLGKPGKLMPPGAGICGALP